MKKRYYLAYGSNLSVVQMRMRCPQARVAGTAEIPDYQLLFKGSKTGSYLTIEPKEGATVPVAVWEVTEEDERALDRYEGYPTFYYKAKFRLPVTSLRSGKVRMQDAFVYIMHEDRPLGIPSQFYMETCFDGYRCFDFDKRLLMQAYATSAKGVSA